ncbi:hypothetical protein EDC96DRAFT_549872 [Choanephora cucurbitarum]|nr:hypothetical protein EDC96DRAFT_549872 [Choanephora cucurbitarum]
MTDFKATFRQFIQVTEAPHLILFIIDYRKEIESAIDGDTAKDLKVNLLKMYQDIYREVYNCTAASKLYEVQWCVWEKLFTAVERRKKLVDYSVSNATGSSEIAGVKRLLDEMSIVDWKIPEPSENGLIVGEQVDFNQLFYDYQKRCLSKFQAEQFYNWRTDLHKLLSLSSIVFVEGPKGGCDFLEPKQYQSLYENISGEFVIDEISFEISYDLQQILWEYKKQYNSWAAILKVVEAYKKYRDDKTVLCILEVIVALLPEMTVENTKRSEMHVQCSYVHNFVKSIFKIDSWHHPHSSNTINNFYGTRPDYLVDVLNTKVKSNNLFGECKGKEVSVDSCNRDKYRLALFSQVAMQQQKLKSVMSFFSVDNEMVFYMMKKSNGLYFFCEIGRIAIPTTESTFITLGSYFSQISVLRKLYEDQCHEKEEEESSIETLPWTALTSMVVKK